MRKVTNEAVHGCTIELLTDSNGQKIGKSTGGGDALWMNAAKTSPYTLFQFMMNIEDSEVEQMLLKLTFLPLEEISDLISQHTQNPQKRLAQTTLAEQVTTIVHGQKGIQQARGNTQAFFTLKSGDIQNMTFAEFENHFLYTEKN